MEKKIEEILGYTTARGQATETIARRYYVMDESPEMAKKAFEAYADSLPVPADMELGDVSLDEDTNSSNLFYGTINFRFPDPKIKRQIAKDLFEVYGEKISEGRKTGSHERVFRIESDTARNAEQRFENYIRGTMPTSGRLHINNITVDEAEDGTGFFVGRVEYSNPDTFASRDKVNGIVPAYGSRYSGNKTSRSREHIYELRGYQSVQDAWHALNGNFGGHADIESIDVEEDSGGAERLFTGRIRYLQEEIENEYNRAVSFEVSGTQTKMTCSLQTRGGWAAFGRNPSNYGGLIGVTNDGVEGVDIDTAVSTFTETIYLYPWYMTTAYMAFLSRAYGCVNTAPFRSFDEGEVRFLGASGSYKNGDKAAELTFKFAVSPNAWNIRVGQMNIPFKYGWDYLWVRWADRKNGNFTVKVPIEAYVEKVYPGMNFRNLGVG